MGVGRRGSDFYRWGTSLVTPWRGGPPLEKSGVPVPPDPTELPIQPALPTFLTRRPSFVYLIAKVQSTNLFGVLA